MKCLDVINNSVDMSLSMLQDLVMEREASPSPEGVLQSMGSQSIGHDQATELTN